MQIKEEYDVAIIGGGLAGLSASIQLARIGHSVILFEKEKYPFHKVCGEYISLESWNFLKELGLPFEEMNLPIIDTLFLTAPNGKAFTTKLPLGGFGISRYKLDSLLANLAKQNGVHLIEETKIDDVLFDKNFQVRFHSKEIISKICCGAYGKRSNLDIKWKRDFLEASDKRLDNYVGVKYHVRTDWEMNMIGLHNFENGYCGISKIEDDKYCLCYMTKAENLKKCNNNIENLEETILYENPHLKKIFLNSEKCKSFPVTISQINFNKKTQTENHMLMLGDTAGMITPLCGNGMSIALHTSKIAAEQASDFLEEKTSRDQMEEFYKKQWKYHFEKRLKTGRALQHFFGSTRLSNLFVGTVKLLPFLSKPMIKMTHGKPF
jgi:menaquinone-9 beta-reductase